MGCFYSGTRVKGKKKLKATPRVIGVRFDKDSLKVTCAYPDGHLKTASKPLLVSHHILPKAAYGPDSLSRGLAHNAELIDLAYIDGTSWVPFDYYDVTHCTDPGWEEVTEI